MDFCHINYYFSKCCWQVPYLGYIFCGNFLSLTFLTLDIFFPAIITQTYLLKYYFGHLLPQEYIQMQRALGGIFQSIPLSTKRIILVDSVVQQRSFECYFFILKTMSILIFRYVIQTKKKIIIITKNKLRLDSLLALFHLDTQLKNQDKRTCFAKKSNAQKNTAVLQDFQKKIKKIQLANL